MKKKAFERYTFVKSLVDSGKTTAEISEITGTPATRLTKYLSEKGIKANRHKLVDLTDNQYQLLLGSLLGDGCIDTCGKNTPTCRFVMKHSALQEEYIDYKISLLGDLFKRKAIATRFTDFNNGYSGTYTTCEALSINHPIFNSFREQFYVDGHRGIPTIVSDLNELGLAIWFMDDGSKTHKTVKFYTDRYTEQECESLRELLKTKFGLETILQRDVRYGKEKLRIYVRLASYPDFKRLVEPFIPESMRYKLP